MGNLKEWFSAGELAGLDGLPKSPQGVNKRARTQHWTKRERDGVQGGAVEYHYRSLPNNTQKALGFNNAPPNTVSEPVSQYKSNSADVVEVSKLKLLTAIETLEEILTITNKTMPPAAKAQMVWMIYELLNEESANEKILGLMKLVA